jgi:hypothetical protein
LKVDDPDYAGSKFLQDRTVYVENRFNISACRPGILTEVFYGIPQSLQESTGVKLQIGPKPLPSASIQVLYSIIIPSIYAIENVFK